MKGTRTMMYPFRRRLLLLLAVTVAMAAFVPQAQAGPRGRYIVTVRDGVAADAVARDHAGLFRADVTHVYRHAINGYAAALPQALLTRLQGDPRVAAIEVDGVVSVQQTTQSPATWGLDRIDQRNRPLDNSFTYSSSGAGVTAYIIDTGIRYSHNDFGGRATFGFDSLGGDGSDCNGHGTHVAGTVGGTSHGVAKSVNLVAVRVLNCSGSGTTAGVIAGVDWVTQRHRQTGGPSVANMSLGGGASTALDNAVRNSITAGVSYAIAAGNGNILGFSVDACSQSPARVAQAMTIGASNSSDAKAGWSNHGSCVDWHAPGVSITSAWHTTNTAVNTISGTSMAAPHTAGVAAQYLATNPSAAPEQVHQVLFGLTTKGIVTGTSGGLLTGSTPNNHLLYTDL